MRILAIRGENIASLDAFEVDFCREPLASAGIFAITGPTGSGKSSLLDAMCLALYHRAPRLEGVSNQEAKLESRFGEIGQDDIRNLIRRGAATGYAATDFLGVDGERYTAYWGYRAGKRSNASAQEEVWLKRLSDNQILENQKKGVRDRVCLLVGLTYEQFSRTVLLAQGRFAEFLKSRENERAELLEKLTGTEIYSRISRAIHERKQLEESSRKDLDSRIQGLALFSDEQRDSLAARRLDFESRLGELRDRNTQARGFQDAAEKWTRCQAELLRLASQLEISNVQVVATQANLVKALGARSEFDLQSVVREEEIREAVILDTRIEAQNRQRLEVDRRLIEQSNGLGALESERDALQKSVVAREAALVVVREFLEARVRLEPVAEDWQQCRTLLELCQRAREEMRRLACQESELEAAIAKRAPRETELLGSLANWEATLEGDDFDVLTRRAVEARAAGEQLLRAQKRWQLQSQRRVGEQRQREAATELIAGRADLVVVEEAAGLARRMLDTTRMAVSESVESLRQNLIDGEACPVCGSCDHVLGKGDNRRLHELLAQQEELVAGSESRLQVLRGDVARLEAEVSQCDRDLVRIGLELDREGTVPEALALLLDSVPEDLRADRIAEMAQSNREAGAKAEKHLEIFALAGKLKQELSAIGRELDADRIRVRQIQSGSEALEQEFARHEAVLNSKFGSNIWRAKWEADPSRYLDGLERQIQEFRTRRQERANLEIELGKEQLRCSSLGPQIEIRSSEVGIVAAEARQVADELEALQARRGVLLEGVSVAQAREHSRLAKLQVQGAVEAARADQEITSQEHQRLEGGRQRLELEATELRTWLVREGPRWVQITGGTEPIFHPDTSIDGQAIGRVAVSAASAAASNLAEAEKELVRLETELAVDDRNRQQVGGWRREYDSQALVATRWANLSAAIGSADGKAFRTIAQQYTLEILLAEANRELSAITPRYGLKMLGESMHFGVVDHDAFGEMRSVHTLSGGESFIVSLALALGLSHMAGGELAVESLFIDEGFGTLDSETLRCVMVALSSLHAQGRKVGLITHVEEMKEQIPVRIEVVKMGQGTSRVQVRG